MFPEVLRRKAKPPATDQGNTYYKFLKYSHSLTNKQSKRHKDITRAVTNILAKDMMPFSIVDRVGFRKMMSVIDPQFELPD